MLKRNALITTISCFCLSAVAQAEPWQSATYLGFGIESPRSDLASGASGSAWGLELAYGTDDVMIGFRTFASGGKTDRADYLRLSSGPVFRVRGFANLWLGASVGFYSKSGSEHDQGLRYHAKGPDIMLDWQRIWEIAPQATAVLGGYMIAQDGQVTANSTILINAKNDSAPNRDFALTSGLKLGIVFRL